MRQADVEQFGYRQGAENLGHSFTHHEFQRFEAQTGARACGSNRAKRVEPVNRRVDIVILNQKIQLQNPVEPKAAAPVTNAAQPAAEKK